MQVACRAQRALIAAVATAALAVPGLALAQDGTGGSSADDSGSGSESTSTSTTRQPQSPAQRSARRALVVRAQRELGVRADGVLGSRTRAAIRRFQRRHDLKVTGRLDRRTVRELGVGASAARPRAVSDDSGAASETAAKAVAAVKSHIGAGYASGGNGPGAFDCSGLTVASYREAGITLPRTSFAQSEEGTAVERDDIQPGDLVFFDSSGPGASHVGIAVSEDTIVSATSSGGVMEHPIDDSYWGGHYVGARRVA